MAAVTCPEIRDLFSARADETISAAERAVLEGHLRACADCAREWQRFAATLRLLRAVEPARAPAGFVDRVLAARPQPWYRRLAQTLLVPWPVKLPLEAAAVVLVAGLAVMIFQRSPALQQAAHAPDAPAIVRAPEPAPALPSDPVPTAPVPAPNAPARPAPGAPAPPVPASPPAARQELTPSDATGPPAQGAVRNQDRESAREARAKSPTSDRAAFLRDSRADEADRERTEPPMMGLEPSRGPAGTAPTAVPEAKRETSAPSPRASEDAAGERQPPPASAVPGEKPVHVEGLALRRDGLIAAASQVEARLAAPDRAAAEREIRALIARLGGVVTARGESLEIVVPRDAWDEVAREIARIGTLRIDRRPPDLSSAVRLTLRLE